MTDYILLVLAGLFYSFSYAFFGLIGGVILVLVLRKFNLLHRDQRWLRLFVKLYYVVIPVAFLLSAWLSGSLLYTQGEVVAAADETLEEVKHQLYPPLAHLLNHEVKALVESGNVPTNEEIMELFFEKHDPGERSGIVQYTLELSMSSLLDYTLGASHERHQMIGAKVGDVSTEIGEGAFDAVKTMVHGQISTVTFSLLSPILLAFLLALLIPGIEIGIALYLRKKKLGLESSQEES